MKICKTWSLLMLSFFSVNMLVAQAADRWQQRVEYEMEIDMDVTTHQYMGKQKITYYNNSPDDLNQVFYHLYFNAFQPNSMMDVRSRTIADADPRVGGRISKLTDSEMGFHKIKSLKQDGEDVKFEVVGTILEVELAKPVKSGKKTVLEMEYQAQVPIQIRRSGRDSKEGISYSMSQWYPKLCEYDYQGWHANPYVGREFHGVWGDFDVKISIDNQYIIGGSGYLQNANEIGYGYSDKVVNHKPGGKLTWHFNAPNVHDFFWGADPDYTHTTKVLEDGLTMHFLYQENEKTKDVWERLPDIMAKAIPFMNENFGKYPYKQYTFIQGGDGGMEYPMGTLITGERSLGSLVGVSVHEWFHSWYQMVLAFNEALYPWMDEGFTSFGSTVTMAHLREIGALRGENAKNIFEGTYNGYQNIVKSGREEPLTTHADHYNTNMAYGIGSYVKGQVFLNQLEYIIGEDAFRKTMLNFYETWKFKHPNTNDFIRVAEKASGMELDWYKEHWINTTNTIDYSLELINEGTKKGNTIVTLKREGIMPMPIDVAVTLKKKGEVVNITVPLRIMRGEKTKDGNNTYEVAKDWPWTHPTYELLLPYKLKKIQSIEIDPTGRMADINRENNLLEITNN